MMSNEGIMGLCQALLSHGPVHIIPFLILMHSLSYKSECGNSFIYSILILYIKKIRKVITNIKQLNARDTIKFNNSENLSNN